MNPHNFFAELKRRNVYKVAVAYAIVGWLLIQIATQVFPFLEIPNWVVRLVIALVAIGFPIALIIAWAFELTPQGIKRAEDIDPLDSRSGQVLPVGSGSKNRTWIYVAVIGAALSVGLFFIGRYTASRTSWTEREHPPAVAASPAQKSIAVLPFLNESSNSNDEYFSDGLSEELIAALAQIRELKASAAARHSVSKTEKRNQKPSARNWV